MPMPPPSWGYSSSTVKSNGGQAVFIVGSVPVNLLLTGEPGVGKSTVVRETVDLLEGMDVDVAGAVTLEVRGEDGRTGFEMVDVSTGGSWRIADVGFSGPEVGRYGVDASAVDEAIGMLHLTDADLYVVDEVAPMQLKSERFEAVVRELLDRETPVFGAVKKEPSTGFARELHDRDDVEVVEVTRDNRSRLPEDVVDRLLEHA